MNTINIWTVIFGTFTATIIGLSFVLGLFKLFKSPEKNDVEEIRAETKFQTKNIIALDRLISMADETLKNQRSHTKLFEKLFSTQERLLTEIDKEV